MTADPKPEPRIRDSDILRIMHADRTKQCAITEDVDGLELHHILPRSQGGDDVRANLVFLRADIHRRITANDPVAMRLLGEHIRTERLDTMAYLTFKLGAGPAQDWMRRRLHIEVT